MTKEVKNTQPQNIEFRLSVINLLSYYEKDTSEYGLTKSDLKKSQFGIGFNVKINPQKGSIVIKVKADSFCKKENEKVYLFGIETLFEFEIKAFKQRLKADQVGKYKIPDQLLAIVFNISISGTRGMLATVTTNPKYQRIYIPIIDPQNILKDFKERDKT